MLFRVEAIRQINKSLGDVLLVRPISFSILVGMLTSIVLGIILFLFLFSYTKKIEISGALLPKQGLTRIVAEQFGVIADRRVAEGDTVQAGDVLFVIQNKRTTATEADLEGKILTLLTARRDSYQAEKRQIHQQALQQTAALEDKVRNLGAALLQIDEQISLQTKLAQSSEAILTRYKEFKPKEYIPLQDIEQRESAVLEQRLRLADLRRSKIAAEQELQAAKVALRDHGIQTARNEEAVVRDLTAVEQQLAEGEARREIHVVAPLSGTVHAVSVAPGQTVNAGQTLLAIVPTDSELEAELYAPSRAVGFLWPKMRVQLRYQAYSYQRFGFASGIIEEVAGTALRPEEISPLFQGPTASSRAEPLYRIRVRIDKQTMGVNGKEWPLRPGSLVDASVLTERRRLIQWMVDPLFSMAREK